jgi:hypothetical protein
MIDLKGDEGVFSDIFLGPAYLGSDVFCEIHDWYRVTCRVA